jgi:PAS domain S-box-containing protein
VDDAAEVPGLGNELGNDGDRPLRETPGGPSSGRERPSAAGTRALTFRGVRLEVASRNVALLMAGLVGAMAVGVLAGWALGIPDLRSWLPGLVETKVNAALCFLGLAAGLALVSWRQTSRQVAVWAASLVVVSIAVATLLEHFARIDLGIDQALVQDMASATSPHPGRFAVMTAVGFLAAAVAPMTYGKRLHGLYMTELMAAVAGTIGGLSLLGYLYGADELRSLGSANQISLPASCALLAMGAGLIASNPDHSLVRQMSNPDPAGQVARRIVPAALVIIPLGAWVRLIGERAGLYDESIGLSIMVTLEAIVLVAVGVWTTASVTRLEAQRRQAELDLARLGAAVSTPLIQTAPVGLGVLDRDLRYLYVNPALARMNGLEPLAHLGQRIDRISPQLGPDFSGALEGVLVSGRGVRELEIGVRNGTDEDTWLLSAEALRGETGETLGLALSMVDISERKRREQALAALSELQKQAQVISESIPFGFWSADVDGRMRYFSQSFLDLIGRTEEEAQGLGWLAALTPDVADETTRDWKAAVSARRPWSFEFKIKGTDGRTHTILSRGFPIRDQQDTVTSWAGINLDISDRRDTEAFQEAFAGILSHELRTPITSIHAASTLLNRPGLEDEQRTELLNDIGQESERLRRLVEDMVMLAKVERGTIQIHSEPVLVPHVLRGVCAQERPRWPGLRIVCTVVGKPPVAWAEASFIEQVARNLISNAAKYGPADGEVEVVVDTRDGCPRVRVLDRGPGVDPDEAARLFELFYRSSRTPTASGSGIGLFLAQRLIQSMNGAIWARPRPDGPGSEFGFILQPMAEDA